MNSYKQDTYEGMNKYFMYSLRATIVWLNSHNLSLKDGGRRSVNNTLAIIFSNIFPVMKTFNWICAPSKIPIDLSGKKYLLL